MKERERSDWNEEERERRVALLDLEIKAFEAIGDAWPVDEESQGKRMIGVHTLLVSVHDFVEI